MTKRTSFNGHFQAKKNPIFSEKVRAFNNYQDNHTAILSFGIKFD